MRKALIRLWLCGFMAGTAGAEKGGWTFFGVSDVRSMAVYGHVFLCLFLKLGNVSNL